MKQDTCIKTLEVELTEDETLQFGKLMAENQIKVCKWEAIKKSVLKIAKKKLIIIMKMLIMLRQEFTQGKK